MNLFKVKVRGFSMELLFEHFKKDALFRNSIYIISSTVVMSFFGFFFWIIASHLFTTENVGLATTVISVMSLITSFSLLGIGSSIIKYLSSSEDKSEVISTSIWLVFIVSLLLSLGYLVLINKISPSLSFITNSAITSLLFVLFTAFYSVNILLDDVFIAFRRADFTFIKNTILSVSKMLLLFAFVVYGGFGIYSTLGLAAVLAVFVSITILVIKFKLKIKLNIHIDTIKKFAGFSFGNYLSSFISGLPNSLLPLLITHFIDAKSSAYFFIALMIGNVLFIIPSAVSQSLFAEGSFNEKETIILLKKSTKLISLILIPIILFILIFGGLLLKVFGHDYSIHAVGLLRFFALSSLFVSINSIGEVLLKLKHNVKRLVGINIVYTISTMSLSYILVKFGLFGIGSAFLFSCFITSLFHLNTVSSTLRAKDNS